MALSSSWESTHTTCPIFYASCVRAVRGRGELGGEHEGAGAGVSGFDAEDGDRAVRRDRGPLRLLCGGRLRSRGGPDGPGAGAGHRDAGDEGVARDPLRGAARRRPALAPATAAHALENSTRCRAFRESLPTGG